MTALGLGLSLPFLVGRGGGVAWTPVALGAALLAWWTADRADLLTLSGAQVTSWKDVVAGYDMAQGVSAARPVYSATGWNGFPGISSDGVDDELTLGSVSWPSGAAPSELWALVQQDALVADTTSRTALSYGGASTASGRGLRRVVSGGANRGALAVGDGAVLTTDTETTVNLSTRHVMRGIIGGAASTVSVDAATTSGSAVVPNTSTSRTRLFAANASAASLFWNGKARDFLITQPLSIDQAVQLAAYLNARRAL